MPKVVHIHSLHTPHTNTLVPTHIRDCCSVVLVAACVALVTEWRALEPRRLNPNNLIRFRKAVLGCLEVSAANMHEIRSYAHISTSTRRRMGCVGVQSSGRMCSVSWNLRWLCEIVLLRLAERTCFIYVTYVCWRAYSNGLAFKGL